MSWKITDVGSNIDNTVFDDWITAYGNGSTIEVNNQSITGWNMNEQPWQGSVEEQLLYNGASQSDIDLVNRMPICVYDPSLAQDITSCNNPDDFVSIPYTVSSDGGNKSVTYSVFNIASGNLKFVASFYTSITITLDSPANVSNEYYGCGYDAGGSGTVA